MVDSQYSMMMHPVPGYGYMPAPSMYWQQPPAAAPNQLSSADVVLLMRQEPKEALLTVDGKEKLRKPVDPPPIIQLRVKATTDPQQHFMQSPYLFMCCSLYKENEDEPHEASTGPVLAGTVVSSLHRLKDVDNSGMTSDGGFFVFGDISVKMAGTHRLRFSLFDLNKTSKEVVFLSGVTSSPFKVVAQKDFKGMEESTYLSRAFSDQGVRLRLRKEPRAVMTGQKRGWSASQAAQQAASPPPLPPTTCTPAMQNAITATAHDSFSEDYPEHNSAKRTRYHEDSDPRAFPDLYATPTTHTFSPNASFSTPSYSHATSYAQPSPYTQTATIPSVGNLPVRPPSFSGMTPYPTNQQYHQPYTYGSSSNTHGSYDLYSSRGVGEQISKRQYQGPPGS